MEIFLIVYEIIFFFFFRFIKKSENYLKRIFFLFEKKKIKIKFSEILKLSTITISNLQKVNRGSYEPKVIKFLNKRAKNKFFFF